MDPLKPARRRELRAQAHHLRPVVAIGNRGLTPAVLRETDVALKAHELVKLRVLDGDRDTRERLLARICQELGCAPVQHLGKLLIVWREREEDAPSAPRRRDATVRQRIPAPVTRPATTGPAVLRKHRPASTSRTSADAPRAPADVPRAPTGVPRAPAGVPRAAIRRRRRSR